MYIINFRDKSRIFQRGGRAGTLGLQNQWGIRDSRAYFKFGVGGGGGGGGLASELHRW